MFVIFVSGGGPLIGPDGWHFRGAYAADIVSESAPLPGGALWHVFDHARNNDYVAIQTENFNVCNFWISPTQGKFFFDINLGVKVLWIQM